MRVNVLFTRNNSLLSRLILALTGDNVSHCVLHLPDKGIIAHSNLLGVHLMTVHKFHANNEIVDTVPVGHISDLGIMKTIGRHEGSGYDLPALFYMGMKLLLGKVGIKLPKVNLWNITGLYLCTEIVQEVLRIEEEKTLTPGQLREKLQNMQRR